jgi:hypothetical protein
MAISDIRDWSCFKRVVDDVKPDMVMMCGDLISDGGSVCWNLARKFVLESESLRKELVEFLEKNKATLTRANAMLYEATKLQINKIEPLRDEDWLYSDGYTGYVKTPVKLIFELIESAKTSRRDLSLYLDFMRLLGMLEMKATKAPEFLTYANDLYFSKFYEAIKYCSDKRITVFIVKGNHDDDFKGAYDIGLINSINPTAEITGKFLSYSNVNILGLGFWDTNALNISKIKANLSDKIDIIIAHAEQSKLKNILDLNPKVVFRGHFVTGVYKISNVLVLSSGFPFSYSIADFTNGEIKDFGVWYYCIATRKWENCSNTCGERSKRKNVEGEKNSFHQGRIIKPCPLKADEQEVGEYKRIIGTTDLINIIIGRKIENKMTAHALNSIIHE